MITDFLELPQTVDARRLRSGQGVNDAIRPRLESVDALRGIVMVIMALDHVRDLVTNASVNPVDLARTTPAIFFTRWITHFCAPTFVFLTGMGAYLSLTRGRTHTDVARLILTRGLWLVVLEQTIMKFALMFTWQPFYFGLILSAIGWSMVALAVLVRLPLKIVGAIGVTMIVLHNLSDSIRPADLGSVGWLWNLVHVPGLVGNPASPAMLIGYPLIPWIGVAACGYAFGPVMLMDAARRRQILLRTGAVLVTAFLAIRTINEYGDPAPWSRQQDVLFTVMSFLNCQKYPPSLLFLLMTLGPMMLLLSMLERVRQGVAGFFVVFGRVPLFYYIVHFYLIHVGALVLAYVLGQPTSSLFGLPAGPAPGYGQGLPGVYLFWIVIVLTMYPLCRWFAGLKAGRRDWWLSYI
jgi:uncharacterized membrane protein